MECADSNLIPSIKKEPDDENPDFKRIKTEPEEYNHEVKRIKMEPEDDNNQEVKRIKIEPGDDNQEVTRIKMESDDSRNDVKEEPIDVECDIVEVEQVIKEEEPLDIEDVNENPTQPFKCEQCKECFETTNQLKEHKERHRKIDSMSYKCKECDQSFLGFLLYRNHCRTHQVAKNNASDTSKNLSNPKNIPAVVLKIVQNKASPNNINRLKTDKYIGDILPQPRNSPALMKIAPKPDTNVGQLHPKPQDSPPVVIKILPNKASPINKIRDRLKTDKHEGQLLPTPRQPTVSPTEIPVLNLKPMCHQVQGYFYTNQRGTNTKRNMDHEKIKFGTVVCNVCGRTFQYEPSLQKHFNKMHKGQDLKPTYRCSKCLKTFYTRTTLEDHGTEKHMDDDKKFRCEPCNKSFITKLNLDHHLMTKHPDFKIDEDEPIITQKKTILVKESKTVPPKTFQLDSETAKMLVGRPIPRETIIIPLKCDLCNEDCKDLEDLKTHKKIHNDDIVEYKCKICVQTFKGFFLYKDHCKTHKTDLTCTLCQRQYDNKKALMQHQIHWHWDKFSCYLCATTFTTLEKLDNHFGYKHKDVPRIEPDDLRCYICNETFHRKEVTQAHIERWHPLQCGECHRIYKQKATLTKHIMQEHFRGTFCDAELVTKQGRGKLYVRIRNGNALCNICGRTFNALFHLENHFVKMHPGQELKVTYRCSKCEDVFDNKAELQSHATDKHMAESTNFTCEFCNSSFVTKLNLKHHIITKHPDFPVEEDEQTTSNSLCGCRQCTFGVFVSSTEKTARCKVCKHVFRKYRRYIIQAHFKTKHPDLELNVEYKCWECDKYFKNLKDARHHRYIEHKFYDAKYYEKHSVNAKCNVCSRMFDSRAYLEVHFKKNHPESELVVEYKCHDCDEFFKTTAEVKAHKRAVHVTDPSQPTTSKAVTVKCNICDYVSSRTSNIERHFKIKHPDEEYSVKTSNVDGNEKDGSIDWSESEDSESESEDEENFEEPSSDVTAEPKIEPVDFEDSDLFFSVFEIEDGSGSVIKTEIKEEPF